MRDFVAVIFAAVPVFGFVIAGPCAFLALVFGIVGFVRGIKVKKGIVFGIFGVLFAIACSVMIWLGGGTQW